MKQAHRKQDYQLVILLVAMAIILILVVVYAPFTFPVDTPR